MAKIEFNVYGVKQISALFSRLGNKIKDFRPVWGKLRDDFYELEQAQFDSEGSRGLTGAWQSLSPQYASWKEKKYPGRPIMVLTGNLKESLTKANHTNAIYRAKPQSMEIGTNDKKAQWHFLGSGRLPKPPNARRVIDLSNKDRTRWFKLIQKYTFKGLK